MNLKKIILTLGLGTLAVNALPHGNPNSLYVPSTKAVVVGINDPNLSTTGISKRNGSKTPHHRTHHHSKNELCQKPQP